MLGICWIVRVVGDVHPYRFHGVTVNVYELGDAAARDPPPPSSAPCDGPLADPPYLPFDIPVSKEKTMCRPGGPRCQSNSHRDTARRKQMRQYRESLRNHAEQQGSAALAEMVDKAPTAALGGITQVLGLNPSAIDGGAPSSKTNAAALAYIAEFRSAAQNDELARRLGMDPDTESDADRQAAAAWDEYQRDLAAETATVRDADGFDAEGFDKAGYDRQGRDSAGFDRDGFGENGLNAMLRDRDGNLQHFFYDNGYDIWGYDKNGNYDAAFDRSPFERSPHRAPNEDRLDPRDASGYDYEGFDAAGFDKDGFDSAGFDEDGYDLDGFSATGFNRFGEKRDRSVTSEAERIEAERKAIAEQYDREQKLEARALNGSAARRSEAARTLFVADTLDELDDELGVRRAEDAAELARRAAGISGYPTLAEEHERDRKLIDAGESPSKDFTLEQGNAAAEAMRLLGGGDWTLTDLHENPHVAVELMARLAAAARPEEALKPAVWDAYVAKSKGDTDKARRNVARDIEALSKWDRNGIGVAGYLAPMDTSDQQRLVTQLVESAAEWDVDVPAAYKNLAAFEAEIPASEGKVQVDVERLLIPVDPGDDGFSDPFLVTEGVGDVGEFTMEREVVETAVVRIETSLASAASRRLGDDASGDRAPRLEAVAREVIRQIGVARAMPTGTVEERSQRLLRLQQLASIDLDVDNDEGRWAEIDSAVIFSPREDPEQFDMFTGEPVGEEP